VFNRFLVINRVWLDKNLNKIRKKEENEEDLAKIRTLNLITSIN